MATGVLGHTGKKFSDKAGTLLGGQRVVCLEILTWQHDYTWTPSGETQMSKITQLPSGIQRNTLVHSGMNVE